MNLKEHEVPHSRETFGGDERAINRHSQRQYKVPGHDPIIYIDRNNSGCPPFYKLFYFNPGATLATTIQVDGKEYWGDGLSWPKAIAKASETISRLLETGGE